MASEPGTSAPPGPSRPAAEQLSYLTLLAVLACVLVYVVALGTSWGRHVDAHAIPRGASGPNWARAHVALRHAVDTIHVTTLALGAVAAAVVAMRRGRRDLAFVAIATLAGANLTTTVLKPLLGRTDPLGGEAARKIVEASFPSGHATAAMSLALVAVIVAPRAWRPWVAAIAAGYAACVGVGLVLLVAHYPSDVVGGYLVAAGWAGAMSAIALRHRESSAPDTGPELRGPQAPRGAAVAVMAVGVALLATLLLVPAEHLHHGLFAVSSVVIAGLALLLPAVLTLVLARAGRPGGSQP
jgi:membrane-associated phospholipid phosphatase